MPKHPKQESLASPSIHEHTSTHIHTHTHTNTRAASPDPTRAHQLTHAHWHTELRFSSQMLNGPKPKKQSKQVCATDQDRLSQIMIYYTRLYHTVGQKRLKKKNALREDRQAECQLLSEKCFGQISRSFKSNKTQRGPVCVNAFVCVGLRKSYETFDCTTGSFRDMETGRQKLQSGIGPISSQRVQKPAGSDLGSFLMIYRNQSGIWPVFSLWVWKPAGSNLGSFLMNYDFLYDNLNFLYEILIFLCENLRFSL